MDVTGFAGMDGLSVLQGVLDGSVSQVEGLHETLDIHLAHVARGEVHFSGAPGHAHRNPHGTVHGGWYLAMLDAAMGLAVFSMQSASTMSSTLTLEAKIIRPLTLEATYRAEARVTHSGRSTAHAEAIMRDVQSGKTVATATSTFAVFARPE